MSRGINKVILVGNLGAEADLRFLDNGTPFLKFRLATSERFRGKDNQWEERTEWHNVVFWRASAEALSNYLSKGACVMVDGTLRTSSFDKDGVKRYRTEVVAQEVHLVGPRAGTSREQEERSPDTSSALDDLPLITADKLASPANDGAGHNTPAGDPLATIQEDAGPTNGVGGASRGRTPAMRKVRPRSRRKLTARMTA